MIREFLEFFISGLLIALEFTIVFGMLFAALAVPYAIAIYQLGALPGSSEIDWALFIGVLLMGVWMLFLAKGGRKSIRQFFSGLIESVTRK